MKYSKPEGQQRKVCRSPCGERGLKYPKAAVLYVVLWSLPVRGAWIEMFGSIRRECWRTVAPRAGSVD